MSIQSGQQAHLDKERPTIEAIIARDSTPPNPK